MACSEQERLSLHSARPAGRNERLARGSDLPYEAYRCESGETMTMHTPEDITSLEPHEIFVFGSNLAGRHAGGAAKTAVDLFGAVEGVGEVPILA